MSLSTFIIGGNEPATFCRKLAVLLLPFCPPFSHTTTLSNIKFDKVVVWENGGQNGKSNTASFLQNVAGSLPPMMNVLKDIGGVELPESLIKLGTEGAAKEPASNGEHEAAAHTDAGPRRG